MRRHGSLIGHAHWMEALYLVEDCEDMKRTKGL